MAAASSRLPFTVVPLVVLWALAWFALKQGYWLSLLITVPAAGFLVRLFMIQHDCGHGAFFRHRLVNDWVGRVIGVLTLTPYDFWRRTHALHHATSGNLDRRGLRRHRYADGARISRAPAVGPAEVSACTDIRW
jgi:omega-6 fatty acid desaturase (delta-12 desaturase)